MTSRRNEFSLRTISMASTTACAPVVVRSPLGSVSQAQMIGPSWPSSFFQMS